MAAATAAVTKVLLIIYFLTSIYFNIEIFILYYKCYLYLKYIFMNLFDYVYIFGIFAAFCTNHWIIQLYTNRFTISLSNNKQCAFSLRIYMQISTALQFEVIVLQLHQLITTWSELRNLQHVYQRTALIKSANCGS